MFFSFLVLSITLIACREDDPAPLQSNTELDPANDYFPIVASYQWTFNSNALSDSGKVYSNFDMKIDTATFRNGVFLALKIRPAGNPLWDGIIGLKDSGNVVYTLTDNPPVSTPLPLFKHTYAATEGTKEPVTISGTKYDAIKITVDLGNAKTYSLWFAKGVGLIKDSSNAGASIFSDNNFNDSIMVKSTLVTLQK